jgi:hypothetical protein
MNMRDKLIGFARSGALVCVESQWQGALACRVGRVAGVTGETVLIDAAGRIACWKLATITRVDPVAAGQSRDHEVQP